MEETVYITYPKRKRSSRFREMHGRRNRIEDAKIIETGASKLSEFIGWVKNRLGFSF